MIMITYSSNERNNGKLDEVKKELLKMEFNLWMDDPRDETDDFGIAPGDLHRERIAEAILSANLVLALSSLTWWDSDYCMWEFQFAKRAGKRIVFLPIAYGDGYKKLLQKAQDTDYSVIESIDQLESIVQIGQELADAHAGLLRVWYAYREKEAGMNLLNEPWSMEEERFWEASVSQKDIIKLSKEPVVINQAITMISGSNICETIGIYPGSGIISLAREITSYNLRRKRFWKFSGIYALSVIIILSLLSVYLSNLALKEEQIAEEERCVQQSILLADRSQEQENSFMKMDLAGQSLQSADTVNAQNALRLAEQENTQIQSFRIPQGRYIGAMITQDTHFLIVGEENNLYVVNLSNGEVEKSISLDFDISARQIAGSKNANQVAVVDENGKLVIIDTQTGSIQKFALDSATAFYVDSKDRLWISYDDGHISVSESPWAEDQAVSIQTEAQMPTSILVTDDDKHLVLLLDNGDMQIYDLSDEMNLTQNIQPGVLFIRLEDSISMFPEEYEAVPMLGAKPSLDADALVQSGDNIAALRKRHISVWEKDENHVEYDKQTLPLYGSLSIPASLGGAVVTYHGGINLTKVYPDGSVNPLSFLYSSYRAGGNILAGTTEGEKVAIVQPDGMVKIIHTKNVPLLVGNPQGFIPVLTDDGVFTLFKDGKLYSAEGNVKLDIGTEILLGSNLSVEGYFFTLSQSGQLFAIDTQTFQILQSSNLPICPSSIYYGSNADQLLIYNEKGYCVCHVDNNKRVILDWSDVELTVLKKMETISSAAINKEGTRIALTTSLGRVLMISVRDNILLSEGKYISTGYGENLLFNDLGQLLVLSAGGRIHLYDDKLSLITMTILDRQVMGIFSIQDSLSMLVKFVNGEFALIHSQNLLISQEIAIRNDSSMSFFAVDSKKKEFWLNMVDYTQNEKNPYTAKLYQFKLNLL